MFDVQHERAADTVANLLQLYYPKGCKIIDFTFGTGSLWWKVFETPELAKKYIVTACDAVPFKKTKRAKAPKHFVVHKVDVINGSYSRFGLHDVGLVDFPYRIGKPSRKSKKDQAVAIQLKGPRSWAREDISRFMYNSTELDFWFKIMALNLKAPAALKPGGLLINKIMSVGNGNGGLAAHPYHCWHLLTNFILAEDVIYERSDTGPFRRNGQLERKHGHFQIYRRL
jgi:hypothetical protein